MTRTHLMYMALAWWMAVLASGCNYYKRTQLQEFVIQTNPAGAEVWVDDDSGRRVIGNSPVTHRVRYQESGMEFNSNWWWLLGGFGALLGGGIGMLSTGGPDIDTPIEAVGAGASSIAVLGIVVCLFTFSIAEYLEYQEIKEKEIIIGSRMEGFKDSQQFISVPMSQAEFSIMLDRRPDWVAPSRPKLVEPGEKRTVVLTPVDDPDELLGAKADQLGHLLGVALVESGRFQLVPQDQILKQLKDLQKESYRDCYDQSCRIELGKAVAANSLIVPRVLRLGKECMMTANVLDLKTETVEQGAKIKTGCSAEEILRAVQALSAGLQ